MNLETIKPGLVTLLLSLAAEDMRYPLPEGCVTWFGRAEPFISDQTQVGIYLRLTSLQGYGRPAKRYRSVVKPVDVLTENGIEVQNLAVLEHYREEQKKATLQVQVLSNENTDGTEAAAWLERIADRIRDPVSQRYLKTLGLAVIRVMPIQVSEKPFDDREVSMASLDISLQVANTVFGLDALPIEHVRGSGHALGSTSGTIGLTVELDKPT